MPKSVRYFIFIVGVGLLVLSALALWYGLAPVELRQAQETLAPTLMVAPKP